MHFRLLAIVFAFALFAAPPVQAGDAADVGGGRYVELDVGAVWMDAPAPDGLAANLTDAFDLPFFRVPGNLNREPDPEDWGAGFDALFGFGVPRGLLPGWNLELGGGYSKVEEDADDSTVLDPQIFAVVQNVNGLVSLGYFAGPGEQVNTDFDGEMKFWELRLGLARPFEVSHGITGRLRVGALGGTLDQDYHVEHIASGTPSAPVLGNGRHDLDMEVENFFAGGYLGATLSARKEDKLGVTVGVDVALLYNNADLDVNQEYRGALFNATVADGGIVLACAPLCLVENHERDQVERFGVRPRITGAIDYDFGWAILGIAGSFTYWSFAPQVVNPDPRPGLPGFNTSYGSSKISGHEMIVATVGLGITIPFGRD